MSNSAQAVQACEKYSTMVTGALGDPIAFSVAPMDSAASAITAPAQSARAAAEATKMDFIELRTPIAPGCERSVPASAWCGGNAAGWAHRGNGPAPSPRRRAAD